MRIPSIQKIERQIDEYMKSSYIPDYILCQKIKDIENLLRIAQEDLFELRKLCSGDPCICKTLPGYYDIINKLLPIQNEYEHLCAIDRMARNVFRNEISKKLFLTRKAKMKFKNGQNENDFCV